MFCTKLQNVSLPNSLLYIGNSTFECCTSLTSLFIPNSVVSIGNKAFCFCTSLKSVELPNSLTSIGNNVFEYCDKISSLSIVGKGDWIGGGIDCSTYNLFIDSSITSIKGIQIKPSNVYSFTSIPSICDENSFTDYTGTLHVPATSLATYFTTPYWCNFSNIIGNAAEPNIALNKDSINLNLNFQYYLIATVSPTNAYPNNVIWSTSDSTIATVNNGLITAVTVGECDIIAKCLFSEAICHVVVNNSEIAIYLDQHEALVLPNHIIVLDPTSSSDILPNLKVTSSNPSVAVARVINGKVQVVGIKEGTTMITVGSVDGTAIPATCLVTVYTELGDLNSDGFVNNSDVTALISFILSNDESSATIKNADVNQDGRINISDVTKLISTILSSN